MTEKTIPTKEQVLTTASRKILFECLVKGSSIKEAAKEANLSYRYARKWVAESNIQALVLRETAAKTENLREKRLRQLNTRLDNPDLTDATFAKLLDLQGKLCGWHTQTVTLETNNRQNRLDAIEREEVRRLCLLRHNMLPAPNPEDVYPDIVTSGTQDGDVNADNDVTKSDVYQDVSTPADTITDPLTEKEENPPGDDPPMPPTSDESRATPVNPEFI